MLELLLAYLDANSALHEELDTHHKSLGTHKQSTPRAGEGLPAGAARLGRAALQNHLFELQDAVVDVEGVCHDDGVRDALPVVLTERASAAGVLGAVAGGVFGGHARELPQEAGGVRAKPAEDLGDERDDRGCKGFEIFVDYRTASAAGGVMS